MLDNSRPLHVLFELRFVCYFSAESLFLHSLLKLELFIPNIGFCITTILMLADILVHFHRVEYTANTTARGLTHVKPINLCVYSPIDPVRNPLNLHMNSWPLTQLLLTRAELPYFFGLAHWAIICFIINISFCTKKYSAKVMLTYIR